MEFQVTRGITCRLKASPTPGLTHLRLYNAKGEPIHISRQYFKVYDKTARSTKNDPLGHEMNSSPSSYFMTLMMTTWYEIYWNGDLIADLNFAWNLTRYLLYCPHLYGCNRNANAAKVALPKITRNARCGLLSTSVTQ